MHATLCHPIKILILYPNGGLTDRHGVLKSCLGQKVFEGCYEVATGVSSTFNTAVLYFLKVSQITEAAGESHNMHF